MTYNNSAIQDSFIFADKLLKKITLPTVKKLETLLHGDFSSIFRGHGLDFIEIREYSNQDDIRNIDWNVTARTNKPHVRVYAEEKEHIVWLVIDNSSSMEFGSELIAKKEILLQIVSIIGYLSVKRGDKVGAIVFNCDIELIIPPGRGLKNLYYLIQSLLNHKSKNEQKNFLNLVQLAQLIGKKKSVFFLSDFIFTNNSWKKVFGEICMKNEVTAIEINDPVEENLPNVGYINLTDPETGKKITLDSSNKKIRDNYKKLVAEEAKDKRKFFSTLGLNPVKIYTNSDIAEVLLEYCQKIKYRNKR